MVTGGMGDGSRRGKRWLEEERDGYRRDYSTLCVNSDI